MPTEPFAEWVLAGTFPRSARLGTIRRAHREDVAPFEQRKLWLLNGAHSLMAYAASALGQATVADAIADPKVSDWVEQWWDAAGRHLSLPPDDVTSYRTALLERFANPHIRHLLAQIAADGSQKIPIRAVPVITADLVEGRVEPGAVRLVSSWIAHLRGLGAPVTDTHESEVRALAAGRLEDAVEGVLRWLGLEPGALHELIEQQVRELDLLASTAR